MAAGCAALGYSFLPPCPFASLENILVIVLSKYLVVAKLWRVSCTSMLMEIK
jgi:hypothetical protein